MNDKDRIQSGFLKVDRGDLEKGYLFQGTSQGKKGLKSREQTILGTVNIGNQDLDSVFLTFIPRFRILGTKQFTKEQIPPFATDASFRHLHDCYF